MKSTGIVRKVDELGRVVLPIELRRVLGIVEKDALEIYVDGDKIILKKYVSSEDRTAKDQLIMELKRIGNYSANSSVKETMAKAVDLLSQ